MKIKGLLSLCLTTLFIVGCSSTSKHYKKRVKFIDPLTKEAYLVEQDIIEQSGIIKAKHPTGAEGESKPWIEMPSLPMRYDL